MGKKIAIIGGGNLGTAIAEGLLISKFCKASEIIITKRRIETLEKLKEKGVRITSDNSEAVRSCDLIILAVKPYQVSEVLNSFKNEISSKHILVSVVTGVLISDIEEMIHTKIPVFRAMPNTAVSIQQSMTCISFTNAKEADIKLVEKIFCTLGRVAVIDEN